MTLPALDALFRGPLAPYAGRLTGPDDPRPAIAGPALLEPPVLRERLARFSQTFPEPEPRAVASIWSKHHFSALIPPTLAASLLVGRNLPIDLEAVQVVEAEDGRTIAFQLRHDGTPVEGTSNLFTQLIEGHLAPLIGTLAALTGLSGRVFWGNAGNVFDFIVRQAAASMPVKAAVTEAGRSLLARRHLADGRPNPLFEPVRYVTIDGKEHRRRRICCLRYLHPDQSLCATCPLPAKPKARHQSDS